MSTRLRALVLAIALVLLIGAMAWASGFGLVQRSPEQRERAATALLAGIRVSPRVTSVTLEAGTAIADDFEQGVRRVRVRIVDRLELELEIETAQDVAFGVPPQLCLVGPDPAPDDAGLENRCWGTPDLSEFLAAQLIADSMGHPVLPAGDVIHIKAFLRRGLGVDSVERCDYAPGNWLLEFNAAPVVDGVHLAPMHGPETSLEVPIPSDGPLHLLRPDQSRYCGLASLIYREQGEPPVASP
ncbi:MAG TPA: hypothetical protein VFW02_08545 [Candidatus Limnocylindrales bacterium]|nr:hypothetical protein [Candidatus Limnocylindrales bacterium]